MEYRELGHTGYSVSVIGFGAWAIGGSCTTWHETCLRRHRACMPQRVGITLAMTLALWPHTLLQTDARRRGTWRGQRTQLRDCHDSNRQQGSGRPVL